MQTKQKIRGLVPLLAAAMGLGVMLTMPVRAASKPELVLAETSDQATYQGRNVYEKTVAFTVKLPEEEEAAEMTGLTVAVKDREGDIVAAYTEDAEIWTSVEEYERTAVLEALPDGAYTLTARISSESEKIQEEAAVEFMIDSTPPEVMIENFLTFQEERTQTDLYTGGFWKITVRDLTLRTLPEKLVHGAGSAALDAENWSVSTEKESGMRVCTFLLQCSEEGAFQGFSVRAADALGKIQTAASGKFTVDHTSPRYTVQYSKPEENADSKDPDRVYYRNAIIADIEFQEELTYDETAFQIRVYDTEKEQEVIRWEQGIGFTSSESNRLEHTGKSKKFRLLIPDIAENDSAGYRYELTGTDGAGNLLLPAEDSDREALGKLRVMDTAPPVLQKVLYDTEAAFCTTGTRDYVNAPTTMTFVLRETNPTDSTCLMTSMQDGQTLSWSLNAEGLYETTVTVPMREATGEEQEITVTILDKAGNKAVLEEGAALRSKEHTSFFDGVFLDRFTVDTAAPVLRLEYQEISPDRENIRGTDYFSRPVTVRILVEEHNFSEAFWEETLKKNAGEAELLESRWVSTGDLHVKTIVYDIDQLYELSVKGEDLAGNELRLQHTPHVSAVQSNTEKTVSLKTAVDTKAPVIGDEKQAGTVIVPAVAEGSTADGQPLYSGDITYHVAVYDPRCYDYASGICRILFEAEGADGTAAKAEIDETGIVHGGEGLHVQRISGNPTALAAGKDAAYGFRITIHSEKFNTNGIVLRVTAEDLCGNLQSLSTAPAAIDITAPEALITYDSQEAHNESYFSEPRTAVIQVTERNFQEDCLKLLVNGTDWPLSFQLQQAGNKNRDDAVWEAVVTFEEEQEYEIACEVYDLAKNPGNVTYSGVAAQQFVVDCTMPKITVEYDNQEASREIYYKAPRTARITIEERNFLAEDAELILTAQNGGNETALPTASAWSTAGDLHSTEICFDRDGEFTFDIAFTDLAGNPADDYAPDRFVIDLTAPEIEFYGVEEQSANTGEVRPGIRVRDTNHDAEGTVLLLHGEHHGTSEASGRKTTAPDGMDFFMDDFAHEAQTDDLYTLEVTAYDLAGNQTEAKRLFSVNRFGSVYTFDERTGALVGENGAGVTTEPKDLIITETNVDTLEFREITCSRNGKLKTLREGTEFEVMESGDETTWKQYQYRIRKENFWEDGNYVVTIYSEDQAGNRSDNGSKGRRLEFAVDQTAPSVVITGVENDSRYWESTKEVTIDIEDNLRIDRVLIQLNDSTESISGARLMENGGRISVDLESSSHWQTLRVTAYDAAGNQFQTETLRFLLTPNLWIQLIRNRRLVIGAGFFFAGAGGVLWQLFGKRRKKTKFFIKS